jgi:hypothetical protein
MKPGLRLVQQQAQKQKQKMKAALKYAAVGVCCAAIVGGITFTYLNLGQSSNARAGVEGVKDPVKLRFFEGERQGDAVVLKWRTLIEVENDYFTIERSADGQMFEPIAVIQGAGFSETRKDYNFTDPEPLPGNNVYRLGKTNFEGQTVYSDIITVAITKDEAVSIIYGGQNPANGLSEIVFDADTNADVMVVLKDVTGKQVFTNMVKPNQGRNSYTFEDKTKLAAGVYLVTVERNGIKSNVLKLVKTH